MIKHCLKRCCIIGGKGFLFLFTFLFLGSCTDFFSNSWAPWAARDPSKLIPDVTTGNVQELIELAENNPDLSLAVLKKIAEATKKASGKNKATLQSAAVQAAVNSVGMGQTIIGSAGAISSLDEDAKKVVVNAIDSMPNLEGSSAALFDLLPDKDSPEFELFVQTASAEDIAMAALLLLVGEAKKSGDPSDYVDTFDGDPDPGDEMAVLALALTEELKVRESELPESLRNILDELNLWS